MGGINFIQGLQRLSLLQNIVLHELLLLNPIKNVLLNLLFILENLILPVLTLGAVGNMVLSQVATVALGMVCGSQGATVNTEDRVVLTKGLAGNVAALLLTTQAPGALLRIHW